MKCDIRKVQLLSVHLSAQKDVFVCNFENVRAIMSVSYQISDKDKINLLFLSKVEEENNLIFRVKCEYEFICDDYDDEKQMVIQAVSLIGPKVEEIVALMTEQVTNNVNGLHG